VSAIRTAAVADPTVAAADAYPMGHVATHGVVRWHPPSSWVRIRE
jgi:hypothetical protein